MKSIFFLFVITTFWVSCTENQKTPSKIMDREIESATILKTIENWNAGWKTRDVERAIRDYAEKTDWTNAFGVRVQSKEELRQLLSKIFAMDFVMGGEDHYENEDVDFLTDEIALLRSTNVRTGQKWSDGSLMKDRHIHHLRVYRKKGNKWQIISHMINQANERD